MRCKFLVVFLLLTLSVSAPIKTMGESFATRSHDQQQPKIIIVATAWAIAKYIKSAVNGLGYEPVVLADMKGYSTQVVNDLSNCECYDVDVSSYEKVEKFLEERWKGFGEVAGITSLTDMKLPIARRLAEKFNVPGPDRAILRLTDKKLVSQLIPEYSPKTIYFLMSEIPLDEIYRMIDLHGSIVIKPSRGSGALGTIKLREKLSEPEIRALLTQAGLNNLDSFEWLAQPYISAELYSLEGYCLEGKPTFLGFTGRSRIAMTETACHFPRNSDFLIQKNAPIIFAGINTLIERSMFKNGYFHCEFLVNDKGAYLIDANFGRMGGAAMIEQLAHSFGKTPVEIAQHIIDVGIFGGRHLPFFSYKPDPKPSLCIGYGLPHESTFKKVYLPEGMQCTHTMVAKDHAHVSAIGNSDYAWIAVMAGDPEQVVREVQQIWVETEAGEKFPAFYYVD